MDVNKSADQLLVRVGRACNFKCNFCNVSDNESHVKLKENINDIVRNFHYKLKYSDLQSNDLTVTISGGEPSIFPKETLFALKYISKFLKKKGITPYFEIQTNASSIDANFAKQLKKNGIYAALVSFHMKDKEIFEKVIQVPYSNFYKIIEGINNLHDAGIQVYTNTILSNENKTDFFETIEYIEKTFPFIDIFNIGMIQPHGEAEKILDTIYPRYEEVIGIYNRALFYLKGRGKEVVSHFVGPPACYIGDIKSSLEVSENTLFRKNFNFSNKYLINNINDVNKIQTKDCDKCLYNNVCSGIWKEYELLQTLRPIVYKKDYWNNLNNEKNGFYYKLANIGENLKKIYDRNIRQIIIKSSLGNRQEVYTILKKATRIGFYKITLLIDSDFILQEDITLTGVSNIQMNIEMIDIQFITLVHNFSFKFKPQFRIDIDIFVKDLNTTNIQKIQKIIRFFPNPYIKLHLCINNNTKYIYKNLTEKYKNNIFIV